MLIVMSNQHMIPDPQLIELANKLQPTPEKVQSEYTPTYANGRCILFDNGQFRYVLTGDGLVLEVLSSVTLCWSRLAHIEVSFLT